MLSNCLIYLDMPYRWIFDTIEDTAIYLLHREELLNIGNSHGQPEMAKSAITGRAGGMMKAPRKRPGPRSAVDRWFVGVKSPECWSYFKSYKVAECSNTGITPEPIRAVFMHDIHCVVEIPEHNGFSPGFEFEQVIYVIQVGYMQHDVVCLGGADLLV